MELIPSFIRVSQQYTLKQQIGSQICTMERILSVQLFSKNSKAMQYLNPSRKLAGCIPQKMRWRLEHVAPRAGA